MTADLRVGFGVDVHAFEVGDHVMLGGVGIKAHSDGDVLLHALCDALLGATGLGDIGQHFPDSDPRWRGADSADLLRSVCEQVAARGFKVINVDMTLLAEAPKLAPHRARIVTRVAELLGIEADRVNVKATTTEKLGFLGRAEGLAAQATVLLHRA
jgi:2-C-methyl-D-erythritol 2,4-cyclodiphosphate synthase